MAHEKEILEKLAKNVNRRHGELLVLPSDIDKVLSTLPKEKEDVVQSPQISEEEMIKQARENYGELQSQEGYAFMTGARFVLSRLPQREVEQPEEKKEYPEEFYKWLNTNCAEMHYTFWLENIKNIKP